MHVALFIVTWTVGERYDEYRKRVPRFIGFPKRQRAMAGDEGSLDYEPGILRVFDQQGRSQDVVCKNL